MKYWIIFSILCLVTAYAILAFIAYSLFWPVKTLELKNYSESAPIVLTNTVVHPGDQLVYPLDYCKYTDAANTVHRTLIDGQVIVLTDSAGKLPIGCHNVTVTTAIVPTTINPGRYYLDVVVEYKINLFRTEYIHYHTTYFIVIPGIGTTTSTKGEIIINQ